MRKASGGLRAAAPSGAAVACTVAATGRAARSAGCDCRGGRGGWRRLCRPRWGRWRRRRVTTGQHGICHAGRRGSSNLHATERRDTGGRSKHGHEPEPNAPHGRRFGRPGTREHAHTHANCNGHPDTNARWPGPLRNHANANTNPDSDASADRHPDATAADRHTDTYVNADSNRGARQHPRHWQLVVERHACLERLPVHAEPEPQWQL